MDKYKLAKRMIFIGVVALLASILFTDFILQSNSYSASFKLNPLSTLSTTLPSRIIIFTASGVVIDGDGIVSLQSKYIYIPTNTSNIVLFKNTNSVPGVVTESVITVPDLLVNVMFPVFIIASVITIIGLLILLYRKIWT